MVLPNDLSKSNIMSEKMLFSFDDILENFLEQSSHKKRGVCVCGLVCVMSCPVIICCRQCLVRASTVRSSCDASAGVVLRLIVWVQAQRVHLWDVHLETKIETHDRTDI